MDKQKRPISTFEDLEVWKFGAELRREISQICKKFPKEENYRLKDQLIRASRSVTANIAEGYGRFHYQENIQYCRQARGSLYEIIDHLDCSVEENYLTEKDFKSNKKEIISCIQLVNGYISYLNTSKLNRVKEESIDYTINE